MLCLYSSARGNLVALGSCRPPPQSSRSTELANATPLAFDREAPSGKLGQSWPNVEGRTLDPRRQFVSGDRHIAQTIEGLLTTPSDFRGEGSRRFTARAVILEPRRLVHRAAHIDTPARAR